MLYINRFSQVVLFEKKIQFLKILKIFLLIHLFFQKPILATEEQELLADNLGLFHQLSTSTPFELNSLTYMLDNPSLVSMACTNKNNLYMFARELRYRSDQVKFHNSIVRIKSFLAIDITADNQLDRVEESYMGDVITHLDIILNSIHSFNSLSDIKALREGFCKLSYDFVNHRLKQLIEYAPILTPLNPSYWTSSDGIIDSRYEELKRYMTKEEVEQMNIKLKKYVPSCKIRIIPNSHPLRYKTEPENYPPIVRHEVGSNPYLFPLSFAVAVFTHQEKTPEEEIIYIKKNVESLQRSFQTLKKLQIYHQRIIPLLLLSTLENGIKQSDVSYSDILEKIRKIGEIIQECIPYYSTEALGSFSKDYNHIPWSKIISFAYLLDNTSPTITSERLEEIRDRISHLGKYFSYLLAKELNNLTCGNSFSLEQDLIPAVRQVNDYWFLKQDFPSIPIYLGPYFNFYQDYLGIKKALIYTEEILPLLQLSSWQPVQQSAFMRFSQIVGEIGKNLSKELKKPTQSFWEVIGQLRDHLSHLEITKNLFISQDIFSKIDPKFFEDDYNNLKLFLEILHTEMRKIISSQSLENIVEFYNKKDSESENLYLPSIKIFWENFSNFVISCVERQELINTIPLPQIVSPENQELIISTLQEKLDGKIPSISKEQFMSLSATTGNAEERLFEGTYKRPSPEKIQKIKENLDKRGDKRDESLSEKVRKAKGEIFNPLENFEEDKFTSETFKKALSSLGVKENQHFRWINSREKYLEKIEEYRKFKLLYKINDLSYCFTSCKSILLEIMGFLKPPRRKLINFDYIDSDEITFLACEFKVQMLEPCLQTIKKYLPLLRDMRQLAGDSLILNYIVDRCLGTIKEIRANRKYLAHIHDITKFYNETEQKHRKKVKELLESLLIPSEGAPEGQLLFILRKVEKSLSSEKVEQRKAFAKSQKKEIVPCSYKGYFKGADLNFHEQLNIYGVNDVYATLGVCREEALEILCNNYETPHLKEIMREEFLCILDKRIKTREKILQVLLLQEKQKTEQFIDLRLEHELEVRCFQRSQIDTPGLVKKLLVTHDTTKGYPSIAILKGLVYLQRWNLHIWTYNTQLEMLELQLHHCIEVEDSERVVHLRYQDGYFSLLFPIRKKTI